MKSLVKALCGSLALALALAGVAIADGEVTLEGSFVWVRSDNEHTGALTAVLTPNGDNEWDVAFHFVWEDEPHTYLGRATGALGSGSFEGTAENDNPDSRTKPMPEPIEISASVRNRVSGGMFSRNPATRP